MIDCDVEVLSLFVEIKLEDSIDRFSVFECLGDIGLITYWPTIFFKGKLNV